MMGCTIIRLAAWEITTDEGTFVLITDAEKMSVPDEKLLDAIQRALDSAGGPRAPGVLVLDAGTYRRLRQAVSGKRPASKPVASKDVKCDRCGDISNSDPHLQCGRVDYEGQQPCEGIYRPVGVALPQLDNVQLREKAISLAAQLRDIICGAEIDEETFSGAAEACYTMLLEAAHGLA